MSAECERASRPVDGTDRDVVIVAHFNPGDEEAALVDLDTAYAKVRAGLLRRIGKPKCARCSHRWADHDYDGACDHYPCQCGGYEGAGDFNVVVERREPIWAPGSLGPGEFVTIDEDVWRQIRYGTEQG